MRDREAAPPVSTADRSRPAHREIVLDLKMHPLRRVLDFSLAPRGRHWSAGPLAHRTPPQAPASVCPQNCCCGGGVWASCLRLSGLFPEAAHHFITHFTEHSKSQSRCHSVTSDLQLRSKGAGTRDLPRHPLGETEHLRTACCSPSWPPLRFMCWSPKPPVTVSGDRDSREVTD